MFWLDEDGNGESGAATCLTVMAVARLYSDGSSIDGISCLLAVA
jgi:hypothetical protein